jgi:hypothetical protein
MKPLVRNAAQAARSEADRLPKANPAVVVCWPTV